MTGERRIPVVAPDYVVSAVSGAYQAVAQSLGLASFVNADAASVVQSAVTALGAGGGCIVFARGSFGWGSVPALPKSTPLRILGSGVGVTTIVPDGAAGRRVFDFNKTADHDTFSDVEIGGFTVDCTAFSGADTSAQKGRGHVLIGTYADGVFTRRINLARIWLHDVRITNVPTSSDFTQYRFGVHLVPYHDAASEGTQTTVRDIRIDRVRVEGGCGGFYVGGANAAGGASAPNTNIVCDRVTLDGCFHDTGVTNTAFTANNYFLGIHAQTGDVVMNNCYGLGSGDTGVEMDSCSRAMIRSTRIKDAKSVAFFTTNFNTPLTGSVDSQIVTFEDCHEEMVSVSSSTGVAFKVTSQNGIRQGVLTYRNCSASSRATTISTWAAFQLGTNVRRLIIDGFRVDMGLFTLAAPLTSTLMTFPNTSSSTRPCETTIRGVEFVLTGTATGQTWTLTGMSFTGFHNLEASDIRWNEATTGMTVAGTTIIAVGSGASTHTIRGRLDRVRVVAANDTTPTGVVVNGSGTLTTGLVMRDHDYASAPAGVVEVSFAGTSNATNVQAIGWRWRTFPKVSSTITPGASPYTYQNADGYPETVTVQGGTVSKIELQTDATNFRDTGVVAGAFRMMSGDNVKVTYSVVPTMTKNPER